MKKILTIIALPLLFYGCQIPQNNKAAPSTQEESTTTNNNLINTYRDTRLLFQINYPKDWQITNYIDYDKYDDKCVIYKDPGSFSTKYGKNIYESCGEGTSFEIASQPVPYERWNIGTIPSNFNSISVNVKPYGTVFRDDDENEPSVFLKEKDEIIVDNSKNKLIILVYESKDYSKDDMMLPHVKAYYSGDNYLYEFNISLDEAGKPLNPQDKQLTLFKEILSTFKEIK